MNEAIKQEQRLTALVEAFKADSADYREIDTPRDEEGKRRLLRSLMNIRLPRPMARETLLLQDEGLGCPGMPWQRATIIL